MNWVEAGTMIVAVVALCSGVYSIWKNGRSSRDKMTEVKTTVSLEIASIKTEMSDEEWGIKALHRKLNTYQLNQTAHCAETSTSLKERVKALEDAKPRKRKS